MSKGYKQKEESKLKIGGNNPEGKNLKIRIIKSES